MAEGTMAENLSNAVAAGEAAAPFSRGTAKPGTAKTVPIKTASGAPRAVEPPRQAPAETQDDMDAFVQANEAIMKGMTALSDEMMAFGKKRLDQYGARSESLVVCQDAERAVTIESDFARTASLQYLDHTYNLMSILARMTEEFLTPLQQTAREALREIGGETDAEEGDGRG